MFNNKVVLITGGTGSFGSNFTKYLLNTFPKLSKIIIFSRDELKQYEMQKLYEQNKQRNKLRFFIGDVRDLERLKRAFVDVDYVIHAAALKQVPAAEYNPFESIKTNVMGAHNIIEASLSSNVSNVIALSTDKAAAPINLYGATKLCSDKLFIAANNFKGKNPIKFSVVRYGNVMGSRGSVIPIFINQSKNGFFTITDKNMTRFNISLDESVKMVIWALNNNYGSEIFVPKIPSYKIIDLAKAINPKCEIKIIGIRPGEKIHEEMVTSSDSYSTIDIGKYYVILPPSDKKIHNIYVKNKKGKKLKEGFSYSSDKNSKFLNLQEIKKLLKKI